MALLPRSMEYLTTLHTCNYQIKNSGLLSSTYQYGQTSFSTSTIGSEEEEKLINHFDKQLGISSIQEFQNLNLKKVQ
jgi:hypothetical protein